jgi:hypothetical protein
MRPPAKGVSLERAPLNLTKQNSAWQIGNLVTLLQLLKRVNTTTDDLVIQFIKDKHRLNLFRRGAGFRFNWSEIPTGLKRGSP